MRRKIFIGMIIAFLAITFSCSQPEADGTVTVVVTGTTSGETYSAITNNGIVGAFSDNVTASGGSVTLTFYAIENIGTPGSPEQVFTGGTITAFTVQDMSTADSYTGTVTIDGDMTVTVSRSSF